jgi:predicted nucleic acid-binding protein
VIAVDTSVVVAAFASWHEGHATATELFRSGPRAPAHVVAEAYSVLTRLPPPHRAPAAVVGEFLASLFDHPLLELPADRYLDLVRTCVGEGITGGATYDALIGLTALHAGAKLITRDRRAVAAYESVGVGFELMG